MSSVPGTGMAAGWCWASATTTACPVSTMEPVMPLAQPQAQPVGRLARVLRRVMAERDRLEGHAVGCQHIHPGVVIGHDPPRLGADGLADAFDGREARQAGRDGPGPAAAGRATRDGRPDGPLHGRARELHRQLPCVEACDRAVLGAERLAVAPAHHQHPAPAVRDDHQRLLPRVVVPAPLQPQPGRRPTAGQRPRLGQNRRSS